MTKELKHGSKVKVDVAGKIYDAEIEERFISQSPSERMGMFVVITGTAIPHFPIEINNFRSFYGKIL